MRGAFWPIVAGYLTWLVCGIPGFVEIAGGRLSGTRAAVWVASFVAFGIAATLCNLRRWSTAGRAARIATFAVETASGLLLVGLSGNGTSGATLVIVAAQLHSVFSTRATLVWVVVQSVLLAVVFWAIDGPLTAIVGGGAFAGFQVFAVAASWLAHSESMARQALARTNAELVATRELLAENSRIAERLRISRDLHDALGHHLTALSIQLEVASRLTGGAAAQHITEAHAIARLLLSDVRDVVSRLRESNRIDLTQALQSLAEGAEPLHVHLDVPARLDVNDSAQAHALLRCVQEIITNAARHGAARNLWVRIQQSSDGIALHARDDGRGTAVVTWGNGLKGMRERFQEYAGQVEFRSKAGEGFEVHGFMPRPEVVT